MARYASNFGGQWYDEPSALHLVRRRRWFRHRALVHSLDASTAARLSDEAIGLMQAQELRELIASGGLGYRDCATTDALRARARQARDTAQQATGRRTASAVLSAEASMGAASSAMSRASTRARQSAVSAAGAEGESALAGAASLEPIMPPVGAGRGVQRLRPASGWGPASPWDAGGPPGRRERAARGGGAPGGALGSLAAAAAAAGAAHGWFQLGISLSVCPGDFGRSKMLSVWPRVVLVNTLPTHAIAYKQHDDTHALGTALFPQQQARRPPYPSPTRTGCHLVATGCHRHRHRHRHRYQCRCRYRHWAPTRRHGCHWSPSSGCA